MDYIITAAISAVVGAVVMFLYKPKVDKQIQRTKDEVKEKL